MFKITVVQSELMKALKDISGSVGRGKMDNPTDASVYMRAYNENGQGRVKFLSTNFNEWTSSTINTIGTVEEGVAPLISHSTLNTMIGTINPTLEVTLEELNAQLLSINYVGRKSAIELPALLAGSFIVEPENSADLAVQLPCDILKKGIEKATKIITDDMQKILYNCVSVTLNANNVLFEALDSVTRRGMIYALNHANPVQGRFFVEANKAKNMLAGFDDALPVDIEVGKNNICFKQADKVALLRLPFGNFPSVSGLFPKTFKNKVVFGKDEMINSLKRIQAMYENKSIMKVAYCEFEDLFSTITMNSVKGRISETVTSTLTGESFNPVFSVDTLLKTLFTIDSSSIEMVQYDNGHVSVAPENPVGYLHNTIVMQVSTKDNSKTA